MGLHFPFTYGLIYLFCKVVTDNNGSSSYDTYSISFIIGKYFICVCVCVFEFVLSQFVECVSNATAASHTAPPQVSLKWFDILEVAERDVTFNTGFQVFFSLLVNLKKMRLLKDTSLGKKRK